MSAISDTWSGFAQNEKTIPEYYERLDAGELPIVRGHIHSKQDLFFRKHILNLMCDFETTWMPEEFMEYGVLLNYELLDQLQEEGLISYSEAGLLVIKSGREVIRIICSALDARLGQSISKKTFSKAI